MERQNQIASELIGLCAKKGFTVSTAESCTGGLIAKLLTDVAGSSAVFYGACVTYTNEVKMNLLGVDPEIIEQYTEVSHPCAKAMAERVRQRLGTTFGISTTGYAGPGGGTEADPVGTVYIALSTPTGTFSERFSASPTLDRMGVREAAAVRALEMLRERIQGA